MPRKFVFGPDGTVMKVTSVGKDELITRASVTDIRSMNTSEQVAFASAIKEQEAQFRASRTGKRDKK